jgi:hypothetical protein
MPDEIILIPDASEADGTPYEAAEVAVQAAIDALAAAQRVLKTACVLARNAELSRQIDLGGQPDVAAWEQTPAFRRLQDASDRTALSRGALAPVKQAAAFDPKKAT